jgi:APA family basic amino acid/polyamine antiporter
MPIPWVLAPVGMAGCLWMAMGLPVLTWIRFVIWLVVGLAIYFLYGAQKSRLHREATGE